MPLVQVEESIAAGATVDLFANSIFRYLPWNAAVNIGITQAATGCLGTVLSGSDTLLQESALPIKTAFPAVPDEMYLQDVAARGELLTANIRNTTGGAIVVRMVAQLRPV